MCFRSGVSVEHSTLRNSPYGERRYKLAPGISKSYRYEHCKTASLSSASTSPTVSLVGDILVLHPTSSTSSRSHAVARCRKYRFWDIRSISLGVTALHHS